MGLLLHHNPPGGNSRRVFLAVPSYGEPNGITAFSLFQAHPELIKAGYDVELCLLLGDCHVDDARNRLVNEFLKSSCTDLVFIDADVGFQTADLIRLLSYDRDVVGGIYPKRGDIEEYPVMYVGGEIWSDKDGLIEVAGLPAGFLRIRRNVLETLARDAAEYCVKGDSTEKIKQVFERSIINGARYSSDNYFCVKWRELGGKIYVDPNCYLEHRGHKIWVGTFGSYLRNINGLSLSGLKKLTDKTETDHTYIELMLEWGNMPWAAQPDFIKAAVMMVRQIDGPVLEVGSGMSTLAMAAANPDITIHALEHDGGWYAKILRDLDRLKIKNVKVYLCDLKQYPKGRWYDPPELPWQDFQMVLCDGPPRAGANRNILWDFMNLNGGSPRCLLVDDANRDGKFIPAGYNGEVVGINRKFAIGLRQPALNYKVGT
jgi:predicted O-methyltransferase YrrM